MNTTHDWSEVERVLAIRLDALGNVIMTGPALRALKESWPGRRLTLLTSPAGAAAAALLPEVDEVLVHEVPWMKATALRRNCRPDLALVRRLRGYRFDAAVIFTVYSQSPLPAAMLCYLANIPRRLAHCRENPYQLLTHWVPEREPEKLVRHEVRRQLDLVAEVGCKVADEGACGGHGCRRHFRAVGSGSGAGAGGHHQQYEAGACCRRGGHSRRRSLRFDESATHAVGRPQPRVVS